MKMANSEATKIRAIIQALSSFFETESQTLIVLSQLDSLDDTNLKFALLKEAQVVEVLANDMCKALLLNKSTLKAPRGLARLMAKVFHRREDTLRKVSRMLCEKNDGICGAAYLKLAYLITQLANSLLKACDAFENNGNSTSLVLVLELISASYKARASVQKILIQSLQYKYEVSEAVFGTLALLLDKQACIIESTSKTILQEDKIEENDCFQQSLAFVQT